MFNWVTQKEPHAFLWDDNLTQWYGVTRYAFDALSSGHAPHWNPYQWAGFRIDQVGYYGVFNPVLYLTYLLEPFQPRDMLTLYGLTLHAVGTWGAGLLGRKAGIGLPCAILVGWVYSLTPGPFVQSNWYFVWNAFAIMPFALCGVWSCLTGPQGWPAVRAATIVGLGMATLFYLGNAQYAVYSLCVCLGLLCVDALWAAGAQLKQTPMRPKNRWRFVVQAGQHSIVCLGVCAVAAAPALYEAYRTANSLIFSGGATMLPVPVTTALRSTMTFWHQAHRLDPYGPYFIYLSNLPALAGLALIGLCLQGIIGRRQRPHAMAATIVLGMVFALGAGCGATEWVVGVNRFRYAFKWLFMVPPVALWIAVASLSKLKWQVTLFLTSASLLAGIYNLQQISFHPPSPFANQTRRGVVSTLVPRYRGANVDAHGDARPDDGTREQVHQLFGNGCTYQQIPCLQGYDLSLPLIYRPDMEALFGAYWWFGSPLRTQSFELGSPKEARASSEHASEQAAAFLALLRAYAVGELHVAPEFRNVLRQTLNPSSLPRGDQQDTRHGGETLSLSGASPLVSNVQGIARAATVHADGITVLGVEPADQIITARWWPLAGFRAELKTPEGKVRTLPLKTGRFLAVHIDAPGDLYFTLYDPMATIARASGWGVTLAFAWACLQMRKRTGTSTSTDTDTGLRKQ